jgi:hypothetical protein
MNCLRSWSFGVGWCHGDFTDLNRKKHYYYLLLMRSSSRREFMIAFQSGANLIASTFALEVWPPIDILLVIGRPCLEGCRHFTQASGNVENRCRIISSVRISPKRWPAPSRPPTTAEINMYQICASKK